MTINFDILVYTLIALIPGFIISTLLRTRIPMLARDKTFSFFSFIFLSIVNYLPWIWWLAALWDRRQSIPTVSLLLYGSFFLFLWPCVLAALILLVYHLLKNKYKLLNSFSPTAWDYKFSKTKTEEYVIVVLNDNTKIYAKYGVNSNVANYASSHDIYLEKCYTLDENENWIERPGSGGMYIAANTIKLIEFLEGGE